MDTNHLAWKSILGYLLPTIIMLLLAPFLVEVNRFWCFGIFLVIAVGIYIYIVYSPAKKNYLDIRAVFHIMWIGTIGLASLRLTDYQEIWQFKTWVCLALAYLAFQIGVNVGLKYSAVVLATIRNIVAKLHIGKVTFSLQQSRLFYICVCTTLIGFICFAINVAIRGYIPCFSSIHNAYIAFYTRWNVFAVAATAVSGLCYYCIKTQTLSRLKKIILLFCIFYSTILYPILVVSRGNFVVSAVSLTVVVFYLHRQKLWILISCLLVIGGIYLMTSALRGYTDEQLDAYFEPSTITMQNSEQDSEQGSEKTNQDADENLVTFTLPPKLAFIYSYLTVSHDNFNEAVENSVRYSYGIRQLAPFNVILRSQRIKDMIAGGERYLVREHLNTTNLIGDFYYDFHEWGVCIFMLLWAFVFAVMQQAYQECKGPFSLMVLGNAMVPVALCFFASWLSNFSQWLQWGMVLLMAIAATIKIDK